MAYDKNVGIGVTIGATVASGVGSAFKSVSNKITGLTKKTLSLEAAQKRIDMRTAMRGNILGAVAMGAAIAIPIKKAIEFESVMADVKKVVTFETPEQFVQMGKSIREMSTRIPMTASGLGDIVAAAGQAGIARKELLGFAEDAAKMGVAFDMTGKQAGSAMTGLRTIFKLNQKQVVSLGDAYNHLSNNMDATARDLLKISNRAGSSAKLFGLTGQQVGALSATFLALKTPPEVAGTAINALLLKLGTANKQGKKFQAGLKGIGLDAKGMKKAIKKDAQGALIDFLKQVKKSDDVMGTLSDLFGAEYSDDIAKLVDGLDGYEKALGLVSSKAKYAGSMEREYQERAKTTANTIELLRNQTTSLAITMGSVLLPAVNSIVGGISPLIGKVTTLAEKYPTVTKVVVGLTAGFVVLKIALMAARYGFSFVADGASMVYRGFLALRATTIFTTAKIWLLNVAQKAYAIGSTIVVGATRAISIGFRFMSIAIMANPIGAVVAGLAIAATLVIMNWDKVKSFFITFWDGIKAVWSGVTGWFDNIWSGIKKGVESLDIMKTIGNKIIAGKEWLKGVLTTVLGETIANFIIPQSPIKAGPLKDLHKVQILEPVISNIRTSPFNKAMTGALSGVGGGMAALPGARGMPGIRGAGSINITYSPTVNISGASPEAKENFMDILKQHSHELAKMLNDIQAKQARLAY